MHDQGPFRVSAWLEDDMQQETRDFIAKVEEVTDNYIFELTRNDKMTKENALSADQKFVDPFLCPICFYIVQEKNVQCSDCQQIFDDHCLKKWLENNGSCPSCKHDRFNPSVMNRNLRNQLEIVDFTCQSCGEVISYLNRRSHSRVCESLAI